MEFMNQHFNKRCCSLSARLICLQTKRECTAQQPHPKE